MRKQTAVLITLVLVLGVAGLAVQATENRAARFEAVEESDVAGVRGSGNQKVLTPPGWPVRYDEVSPMFRWANGSNTPLLLGNLFNTNSGAPLTPMGTITGVSWVGVWAVAPPTYVPSPVPVATFVMRPAAGPYTAGTPSILVPFPAPTPSYFNFPTYHFGPVPGLPMPGPSFVAAVRGAGYAGYPYASPSPSMVGANWQWLNTGIQRVIATPTGYTGLGFHGRQWYMSPTTIHPFLYSFNGNGNLRLYGNLLTPIELLSLQAE